MNSIGRPTRVRDCIPPINVTWRLVDIMQGRFSLDRYQIYVAVDSNNTVYMKPYAPYYSKEFEELFDFGIECHKYDENKTIQVIKPDNYHTHFA
tara:strand:- start:3982 stop:4263 length:282 start_codon:yes stop_codon:yes gene_type:complete